MSSSNYIKNIAFVGASGNSGSFMAECLIKTGKHNVTALTRADSKSTLPEGLHSVKTIDYNNPSTIVEALKGQDALVITLSPFAAPDTQSKLIQAAADAGVKWILPNGWSPDSDPTGVSAGCVKDVFVFGHKQQTRDLIKSLGKSSFIDVHTGFWYEWSLAIPASFGFDCKNKEVTFFDEGETKISVSTWPQVGRAVAALLSLPITREADSKGCLDDYRDKLVYVNSFTVSQQEMFDAVLKVTNAKREDWKINHEKCEERLGKALGEMATDRTAFAKVMYTRVFYKDGNGDFEKSRGVINDVLDLPKEDFVEATRSAVDRALTAKMWYEK